MRRGDKDDREGGREKEKTRKSEGYRKEAERGSVSDECHCDEDRTMIFSSRYALTALESVSHIGTDGTFKLSPNLWTQLITIHGVYPGAGSIPYVFGLLPNKSHATYLKFFKQVKVVCPSLSPRSCIADFEVALQNAVKCVFPDIQIHGCLFHLSQSCHRKICDIGSKMRYINDKEFQLKIKSFCALAFLRPESVIAGFEMLIEDDDVPAAFITYFEANYIGVLRGRGLRQRREKPIYPIPVWNVESRVREDLPRSNNSIEAFHGALKSSITSLHPNIWKLLAAIKTELARSETKDLHRLRGDKMVQLKKYALVTQKIKNQITEFGRSNDLQSFLLNMANVVA